MVKKITYSFQRMSKDLTESKSPVQFYFDAHNIRFVTNKETTTGSFSFEKGNELVFSIPTPVINPATHSIDYTNNSGAQSLVYAINTGSQPRSEIEQDYYISLNNYRTSGQQIILGHSVTRDSIILFTTDNNGFDCIWKVNDETYDITLLYLRDLEFSENNPIQVINNFENEIIDKVYWVDNGNHQMRYLNLEHSLVNKDLEELIDIPKDVLNTTGSYDIVAPEIINVLSGGSHTSGRIQYAYNLYRLNASQTKLSPLSAMISLDKGILGGGEVNESVGSLPVLRIQNLDPSYTNIKVYSIKYNSYNQTPIISLIEDREIPSNGLIDVFDDNTPISTLSLEQFLFLGSDIIIPKHIQSKDNRMFLANYKEKNFEIDLDTRAYSFDNNQISKVHTNIFYDSLLTVVTSTLANTRNISNTLFTDDYQDKFDSINLNYNKYKYQADGVTFGGEGKYLKYELTQSLAYNEDGRYFKDEEIYRVGIEFFNGYGQVSLPNWIADFRARTGNMEGFYNSLLVTLKPEFYTWLNNPANFLTDYDKPVGYKILIAERTLNDRTIIANGILGTMMFDIVTSQENIYTADVRTGSETIAKLPNILLRNCSTVSDYGTNTRPLRKCMHHYPMNISYGTDTEMQLARYADRDGSGKGWQFNCMLQMYSPEILFYFNQNMSAGLQLRVKGLLKNKYNSNWGKQLDYDEAHSIAFHEVKTINCLSSHYGPFVAINGDPYDVTNFGFISHPNTSESNRGEKNLFYRGYGDVLLTSNSSAKNIISFNNPLVLTTGTDPNNNIIKSSLKSITVLLDNVYSDSEINYTITPDAPYIAELYDVIIATDALGNNAISTLFGVAGVQTISRLENFISSPDVEDNTFNYYLIITSTNLIEGTIDVTVEVDNGSSNIIKEITNEVFTSGTINSVATGLFIPTNTNNRVSIYGTPQLTERGQDFTTYNNDPKYRYSNSLTSIITDGDSSWNDDGACGRKIVSVNGEGQRCITFVTDNGRNDPTVDNWNRPTLESIYTGLGVNGEDYGLIGELVKNDYEIYLGGIYGGNSWEDKLRTNYFEVGEYKKISQDINFIESPGDTMVGFFKFLRIHRKGAETFNQCIKEYEEIVEFYTETTVDLRNRNDFSLLPWDDKFNYNDADYHKYNRVYSQLPDLISRRALNYNIKKINNFDTNIISTKLKSSGEVIDSWTDILPNEVMTLDGKHGPINSLISLNDKIFSYQDRAIAFISINPRVQVQGNDGIQIELGFGQVLQEYKYVSTTSGSVNKWAILPTDSGIYYIDLLNKSFNLFNGETILGISDVKNMHKFFLENLNYNILKIDNPIIHKGISIGWDKITNDIYISVFVSLSSEEEEVVEEVYTLAYNLMQEGFSSFYDYHSSMYMFTKGKMLTVNPNNNNEGYEMHLGNYNEFYGQNEKSSIAFICSPEPRTECTINNLEYKSEAVDDNTNIEIPGFTWNKIRAYNEFQDSTLINLVNRINIRKENRKWRLNIPRDQNKTNRIRNNWSILELNADNTNHYRYKNDDIELYYNPNNKIIE